MSNSFFYCQEGIRDLHTNFIEILEKYSAENNIQTYVIDKPLGDSKYKYNYDKSLVLLIPKHKIIILNFGGHNSSDEEMFEDYVSDFLEDLGSVSDKYEYKSIVGRSRTWKGEVVLTSFKRSITNENELKELLGEAELSSPALQRKSELLISLLTGSINDIKRVRENIPDNILEKIKQKIILFDGDQTRFVYQDYKVPRVTIQGLSGTGKTELLLHKLKEIYLAQENSKILFTCHNKILASSMLKRIPDFFNFMKVEKQIQWDERLWCVHAWGSRNNINSGAYRYICNKYNLAFFPFSLTTPFSVVCKRAIDELKLRNIAEEGFAFDYVLIDESQDFPVEFVELCEMVTKETVYVAGDIFQSIFDEEIVSEVKPDFLLSKCYRTDPRTLMFAHGLGMGLFELEKLRWLSDDEWAACGYLIEKQDLKYKLQRIPLRRFEDLVAENITSMTITSAGANSPLKTSHAAVIDIIKKIIEKNPTVVADDIGIVFSGNSKQDYNNADILEQLIRKEFSWDVNKAYETKTKLKDTVFISNKNHVKGLEFPFVICVSDIIQNALHERNALYMLLTRSFLHSFLVISDSNNTNQISALQKGLKDINDFGYIETSVPSEEEQERIRIRISLDKNIGTIHDLTMKLFDEFGVPSENREDFLRLLQKKKGGLTYEKIKDSLISYLNLLDEMK